MFLFSLVTAIFRKTRVRIWSVTREAIKIKNATMVRFQCLWNVFSTPVSNMSNFPKMTAALQFGGQLSSWPDSARSYFSYVSVWHQHRSFASPSPSVLIRCTTHTEDAPPPRFFKFSFEFLAYLEDTSRQRPTSPNKILP